LTARAGLGAGLFFTLLIAALVCAVLVVRARSPDLVLEVTEIHPSARVVSPSGGNAAAEAGFEFFVRESDDSARVEIVDSHEDPVAVLDEEVALEADESVSYRWDGRTDAGTTVAPGRYRLRVVLPDHDREMVWPQRITVLPPTSARLARGDDRSST
jgi:FlgD Ig-like domain